VTINRAAPAASNNADLSAILLDGAPIPGVSAGYRRLRD